MAASLSEIGSIVWNNPCWAIRNADKVAGGVSRALHDTVSTKQDDAASRGDYAGNGSASQLEVYYRAHSDSHEESERNMKELRKRSGNGWK